MTENPVTIDQIDDAEFDNTPNVEFSEEEIKEIEEVLENGTEENFTSVEVEQPIDPDQLIKALEKLQEELIETELDISEQQLAAQSAAMEVYIDSMFNMNEIRTLLHENSANLFSKDLIEKMENLLGRMRRMISNETNKFNKSLNKQGVPKKDKEGMMRMFFGQTKTLRDDIIKFSQLVTELKRTRKVIKEAARKQKKINN